MDEICVRGRARQLFEEAKTDGRGEDMRLPPGLDYGDTVNGLTDRVRSCIGDKDPCVNALGPQALGEQADVVFDSSEDRVIVLI